MNQTEQYALSQWDKSDRIQMEDFNADNLKTEQALSALAAAVAGKGNCSVQCFTYTGTGVGGSSANQTVISFQRVPTAFVILPLNNLKNYNYGNVMLWGLGGATQYIACGQVPASSVSFDWWQVTASWSGAVLSFHHANTEAYGHYQLNFTGAQYMVIALYQESDT